MSDIEDFPMNLSFDNNNDNDSISSSLQTSKNSGRQFSLVWDHIDKGKEVSRGHYEGKCKYCNEFWSNAKPFLLRIHLASHCSKCPEFVSQKFAKIVAETSEQQKNFKRKKTSSITELIEQQQQSTIEQHYETEKILSSRQNNINNSLIKAFVCCNLSFSIIENLFFIELLKTLCAGYQPPSRRMLATTLLEKEVARTNIKIKNIFEYATNLTLGKYY